MDLEIILDSDTISQMDNTQVVQVNAPEEVMMFLKNN